MARKTPSEPAATTPTTPSAAPSARLDPDVAPKQVTAGPSPEFVKNHGKTILIAAAVLLTMVVIAAIVKGHRSQQQHTAVQRSEEAVQQTEEKDLPRLPVPANGDAHVKPKAGCAVTFPSSQGTFTTHYVYYGGKEGTVEDPTSPHEDGYIVDIYVHDTSGEPNWVTYKYVSCSRQ